MTRHTSSLVWSAALVALFVACAESQQSVAPTGDASAGGSSGASGASGASGQSGSAGAGDSGSDASDASEDQVVDGDATPEDGSDVNIPDAPDGTVVLPGLGAFYAFEESTGPVFDLSGNSNHGTVEGNGVNRGFLGLSGNAISFAGGDGRVTVPSSPSLDFSTGATIQFWLKLSSVAAGTIIGRGTGTSDNHVRIKTAQGNVNVAFGRVGLGVASVISDANVLTTGIWTHVAVVNTGSQVKIYINGDVNKTGTGGLMGPITTALQLGKGGAGTDVAVNATLDEVKWFNVVRTDQEICADAGGTIQTVDGATVCN